MSCRPPGPTRPRSHCPLVFPTREERPLRRPRPVPPQITVSDIGKEREDRWERELAGNGFRHPATGLPKEKHDAVHVVGHLRGDVNLPARHARQVRVPADLGVLGVPGVINVALVGGTAGRPRCWYGNGSPASTARTTELPATPCAGGRRATGRTPPPGVGSSSGLSRWWRVAASRAGTSSGSWRRRFKPPGAGPRGRHFSPPGCERLPKLCQERAEKWQRTCIALCRTARCSHPAG
jgi:hypothetical protein